MHQRHAGVRKRQAGQRRGQRHALAGFQVVAVLDGPREVAADQRDRLFGQASRQRMPALVDVRSPGAAAGTLRCRRRCRPRWRASGRRCRCRPSPSRGNSVSSGSTTANAGPQMVAEHADLDLVLGVGQHGRGRDFAAGAGGRRHADQRHDRAGHLVVAEVVARRAAMRVSTAAVILARSMLLPPPRPTVASGWNVARACATRRRPPRARARARRR